MLQCKAEFSALYFALPDATCTLHFAVFLNIFRNTSLLSYLWTWNFYDYVLSEKLIAEY
jgi:hypothetical protein